MGNLQGSILAGLVSMLIALEREPETALIDTQGYISKLRTFRVTRAISLIYDDLRQVHGLSITDVPNDLVELRQVFEEVRSKYPWLEERKISGHQDSQLDATSVLNDMLQVFRLRQTSTITKEAVLVVAIITGGLCGREGKIYIGEDVLGAAHQLTQSSRTEQPPRSSLTPPGEPIITIVTSHTLLDSEQEGGYSHI